jgi:TonB family protein
MIASWMLYTIVTGVLVALAAAALDRVAVATRRPTRFIWMGAMVSAAIWPGVAFLWARAQALGGARVASWAPINAGLERAGAVVVRATETALHVSANTILGVCWAALTLLLVARLAHAAQVLRVRRGSWRTAWIGDLRVLLSADTGPAVVGLDPMEVVLPSWTLTLDLPLRDLVLRHEDEHRRARDPYLLLAAALLVVLMPWNLALLWMAQRLRLSIELDCDARVLRAHPHHERYGLLLLAIAQRSSGRTTLLATAMSEPAFNLARRISAMRTATTSVSRIRLAALGVAGAAAIGIACSIDAPTQSAASQSDSIVVGEALTRANERAYLRSHIPSVEPERSYRTEKVADNWAKEDPAHAYTLRTDSGVAYTVDAPRGEYRVTPKGNRPEPGSVITYDSMTLTRVAPRGRRPVVEEGLMGNPERERAPEPERARHESSSGVELGTLKLDAVRPDGIIVEQGVMGTRPPERELPPLRAVTGTGIPKYPDVLKNAGIEGEVLVTIAVDPDGRVAAFEVIKSSHTLFTDAVRTALRSARFNAAEPGQPALRTVTLPYVFSIK